MTDRLSHISPVFTFPDSPFISQIIFSLTHITLQPCPSTLHTGLQICWSPLLPQGPCISWSLCLEVSSTLVKFFSCQFKHICLREVSPNSLNCYSKYDLQTRNIHITWELAGNVESKAVFRYFAFLTRSPGICTLKLEMHFSRFDLRFFFLRFDF